ncbi:MAG: ABC transporter ATP-binding protein/permease [Pseudomonadales bacterium]|nr:ABC transporter ATP-binding protein/permease [Pseudomonadales bacterium]
MLRQFYVFYMRVADLELKRRALLSQLLVIVSSIVELASFLMIIPIVAFISGDVSKLELVQTQLSSMLGYKFEVDFIYLYVGSYIMLIVASTTLGVCSILVLSKLVADFGAFLSKSLFSRHLHLDYIDFISKPSTYYSNIIITEVQRLQDNVLQPVAQINARLFSGVFILVILLFIEPVMSIISFIAFGSFYFLMYIYLKNRLRVNGLSLSDSSQERALNQKSSLSLFKDIYIYSAQRLFIDRFEKSVFKHSEAYASLNALYNLPRYFVDGFIYILFAILVALSSALASDQEGLLVTIFIFGFAAIKLLPIFQSLYASLARIRGSFNVVEVINSELDFGSVDHISSTGQVGVSNAEGICLNNLTYRYPLSKQESIIEVNVSLPSKGLVAVLGKSGSGKSTLIDLVTGLLIPSSGSVMVTIGTQSYDMHKVNTSIGFVPQKPLVFEASVASNVAFGEPLQDIDYEKVEFCLEKVGLTDFVALGDRCDEQLSSDGYGISGGQLQRLSIARALYRDATFIVMDEPTSALDLKTEESIVSLIEDIAQDKMVIVIAHRLQTIANADFVLLLENGRVAAQGKYDEVSSSDAFKRYSGN